MLVTKYAAQVKGLNGTVKALEKKIKELEASQQAGVLPELGSGAGTYRDNDTDDFDNFAKPEEHTTLESPSAPEAASASRITDLEAENSRLESQVADLRARMQIGGLMGMGIGMGLEGYEGYERAFGGGFNYGDGI